MISRTRPRLFHYGVAQVLYLSEQNVDDIHYLTEQQILVKLVLQQILGVTDFLVEQILMAISRLMLMPHGHSQG